MSSTKLLSTLVAPNLNVLHASARHLELELKRLGQLHSDHAGLWVAIDAVIDTISAGCVFIENHVGKEVLAKNSENSFLREILSAGRSRSTSATGVLTAIRRASRLMEIHCTDAANNARRLGLRELEDGLRLWAREWIGLELSLNAANASLVSRAASWSSAVSTTATSPSGFVAA